MLRTLAKTAVVAVALAGCDGATSPPGEEIGTFAFEAALLDPASGDGRCDFPESPPAMRFDAVLSYDPVPLDDDTHRFWVQILGQPGEPREGRLSGSRFIVRSPVDPNRVPRSLDACRFDEDGDRAPDRTRCTLGFAEFIGGQLLARVPTGGCEDEALSACGDCGLEPGAVAGTGGICGDITEEVVPEPAEDACLCTGADGTVAEASTCTVVYRLVGRPS